MSASQPMSVFEECQTILVWHPEKDFKTVGDVEKHLEQTKLLRKNIQGEAVGAFLALAQSITGLTPNHPHTLIHASNIEQAASFFHSTLEMVDDALAHDEAVMTSFLQFIVTAGDWLK